MDQECSGLQAIQRARIEQGQGRVQTRLSGAEFAKNGGHAGSLRKDYQEQLSPLQITQLPRTLAVAPPSEEKGSAGAFFWGVRIWLGRVGYPKNRLAALPLQAAAAAIRREDVGAWAAGQICGCWGCLRDGGFKSL